MNPDFCADDTQVCHAPPQVTPQPLALLKPHLVLIAAKATDIRTPGEAARRGTWTADEDKGEAAGGQTHGGFGDRAMTRVALRAGRATGSKATRGANQRHIASPDHLAYALASVQF